eukprot:g6708.t1
MGTRHELILCSSPTTLRPSDPPHGTTRSQEAQLLGPKLSRAEAQRLVDRELERSAERGILAFDHFSEILFQISEQLECHYSVVEDKVVALRRS